MRIAVVGSGISGLASAWLLSKQHQVTLFEADSRLGGHTHTHDISLPSGNYRVDTGFIVCNPQNYPLLFALFEELGVATRPTTMSFSLRSDRSGLEYIASDLRGMFLQRRRLLSPRHWRLLRDILRFYRQAPALLDLSGDGPDLGDWLQANGYSEGFRDEHLVPMASALWSSPSDQVMKFPAKYLVAFMANHHMLQVDDRPQWRVVSGGSSSYVAAMQARWQVDVRCATPVRGVHRDERGVTLRTDQGSEDFDALVLACHSDQALALLEDPSEAERSVLGAIGYQPNETVLHTDPSQLPRDARAWAAWNALIPASHEDACTVSYCMNHLQSIDAPEPLVVTLNRSHAIDPDKVLARMQYAHPVYTRESVAAQRRRDEISGQRNTWYAGAYWGWGFHEDGMRSAVEVARALGIRWPGTAADRERLQAEPVAA
ncbi:NAD(P)/FAD-dependent oxidoreductase [Pseudomarimonas salicorniae]|uniref:FAD-dependent oxidoreductase n=1 Tax=Pseudomarimonas salicorniae TaxID=2933270 RepID=A0ABT0GH42_9GAMM|nr:FAD-dependent oxidoreductase [Lysobacter sp. CAU 1642]MCK7593853.1 FAD-dependent oxidoreductase [Lysobacter sp. CAU 1642]